MKRAFDWLATRTAVWQWLITALLTAVALGASYQVYLATRASIVLSVAYAVAPLCGLLFGSRQGMTSFLVVVFAIAGVLFRDSQHLAYAYSLVGALALYFAAVWASAQLTTRNAELDDRLGILDVVFEGMESSRHLVVILSSTRQWEFSNTAATRALGIPDDFDPGSRNDTVVAAQMSPISASNWRRLLDYGVDSDVQLENASGELVTYRFTADRSPHGFMTLTGIERVTELDPFGAMDPLERAGGSIAGPAITVKADLSVHWFNQDMSRLTGHSVDASRGSLLLSDFVSGIEPERFYSEVWKPVRDANREIRLAALRPKSPAGAEADYIASARHFNTELGEYITLTFERNS